MSMEKRRTQTVHVILTEDLVIDIVSRLPDEDLVRFTCVSKSWRSLILHTDPYLFRRTFLMIKKITESGGRYYRYNYQLDLGSIEDQNPNPREILNPFDNDDDACPRPDARVVATCNGLVALQQHPSLNMAISNPTTKKHIILPPNPAGDNDNVVFCGFGYDRVHDCYKLVAKVRYKSFEDVAKFMVYDLSNGAWRTLQFDDLFGFGLGLGLGHDIVHYYELVYYSVKCVDGALYWCIDMGTEVREMKKMICFVLANEEFHEIEAPDLGQVKYYPNMTVFEGRLCLVCEGLEFKMAEFWMIDMECDRKRSNYSWRWTKLLAISDPNSKLPPPYVENPNLLFPVCFSGCKNKILFLVDESQLFWYDVGKGEFSELDVLINRPDHNGYICDVKTCIRSLVGIRK